ncbi:hypothetical protein SAMD00023353_2701010 [Rosellinia necatrix]|uniref:Uncharacterized protein n=1 Tax=Rosellinia necatrix TaxID=77044 RepID=A0A1S8A8F6_ROSNE|nr:hypothetical protein SAMD00023353_2701010 [Rosellinia necatrix]
MLSSELLGVSIALLSPSSKFAPTPLPQKTVLITGCSGGGWQVRVTRIRTAGTRLDVLVNNTSANHAMPPFTDTKMSGLRRVLETNVIGSLAAVVLGKRQRGLRPAVLGGIYDVQRQR